MQEKIVCYRSPGAPPPDPRSPRARARGAGARRGAGVGRAEIAAKIRAVQFPGRKLLFCSYKELRRGSVQCSVFSRLPQKRHAASENRAPCNCAAHSLRSRGGGLHSDWRWCCFRAFPVRPSFSDPERGAGWRGKCDFFLKGKVEFQKKVLARAKPSFWVQFDRSFFDGYEGSASYRSDPPSPPRMRHPGGSLVQNHGRSAPSNCLIPRQTPPPPPYEADPSYP
jgi:hypothetical protein